MQNSSALIKNYKDTNFIAGVRAFAAFATVLISAGGFGLREFSLIGNHIGNFGAQGIAVFFVISGFGFDNRQLFRWILVNKQAIYIGCISYGIYLSHLPLLNILVRFNLVNSHRGSLTFLIVSLCAILLSALPYFLFEQSCQMLGRIIYDNYKHTRSLII
jgi:peptidoglycan/LPS O-acetylase OafA/YrhL